ncbi:hypothetical protein BZA05DRAFT_448503 [Tricharina praecox]|uniref:uncharacterized protein n=1 Tax=Tricharina praecox TaxID=43433 RepID=UPI00221E5A74|nr:uncharacterized protein BZA05DRAFT_448503 [Tricharina praecox]KAI5844146.1 hypothetical protein BZA05DRAFT_448503 [Tricharina praecox]
MADNEELIVSFCAITGADPDMARHFLEASNWNLQIATSNYYEPNEAGQDAMEEDDEDEELHRSHAAASAPSSSSAASRPKPKQSSGSGAKIRTLGDLSARDDDEDEEDEGPKKRDLFAGGEKSGLAVQDPSNQGGGRAGVDLIQDILKRAAEGGQRRRQEEEEPGPRPRFSGSGHTLGSDANESVTIPDPVAAMPAPRAPVTRTLTFWRDGFSVEDGPLMRYDDPANREILQAIESGRAPLSLMNVEPGQPADVNVFKRLDEDYVAPKKKFVPFSGQGQRLGSVTPGEPSRAAAPAPAPVAAPAAAAAQPTAPSVNVDASTPSTSIQIRLADGTRLVSRFNHHHTVGDLYSFVNASNAGSRSRDYILQTTFPNKELKDHGQSVKDAGLINAVVVQKWAS